MFQVSFKGFINVLILQKGIFLEVWNDIEGKVKVLKLSVWKVNRTEDSINGDVKKDIEKILNKGNLTEDKKITSAFPNLGDVYLSIKIYQKSKLVRSHFKKLKRIQLIWTICFRTDKKFLFYIKYSEQALEVHIFWLTRGFFTSNNTSFNNNCV